MKSWHMFAAMLACLVTATIMSFPNLGPASKDGTRMELPEGETPARVQFARMLAAFNSGDRTSIDAYRRDHVSPYWTHAPTTDMALNWFKQTGGYRMLRIQDVAPNYLLALLRNVDSDDLYFMGVEVEREQPHRLIYLTLNYASDVPGEYWPQPLSDEEVVEALRLQLDRRVAEKKFSGAVLVTHRDKVLFRGAFGFADQEARIANTPATRFRIGRLTNMFTSVALLRLMQDGKLTTDDALGKWLPELMGDDVGLVTLGQLMSNSGATGDIEHLGWDKDRRRRYSLDQLVDEFGDADLTGRPGQRFQYSSLGYVLLAAVVERASGKPFTDYLRESVLNPAGMSATDFSSDPLAPGCARPYRRPAGTADWTLMTELFCCRGAPSADAYSTVDDIAAFIAALDQRRLLDDEHTRLMLEQRSYMWARIHHGYGVAVDFPGEGSPRITLEDGIEGQNGGFLFKPETGHLVVVLANYDAPTAMQLVWFVGARFPAAPSPFEMNIALQ